MGLHIHPAFRWHVEDAAAVAVVANLTDIYEGPDGFCDFLRQWSDDWDDWNLELEELIEVGSDRVLNLTRHRALAAASGLALEQEGADVYLFRDGWVVEGWTFFDRDRARRTALLTSA